MVLKPFNKEVYEFERSKIKIKINDTTEIKYYEYDFYYDDELIKTVVLI